jgi:Family of unknown function (DUF6166)
MKTYHGRRTRDGCSVEVREECRPPRLLDPRLDLSNHSPTGFEWGYPGSGPAQLALAILADFLGDDVRAVALHQEFKFDPINPIADDEFCTSDDMLERWCRHDAGTGRYPEERDQPPAAASGTAPVSAPPAHHDSERRTGHVAHRLRPAPRQRSR